MKIPNTRRFAVVSSLMLTAGLLAWASEQPLAHTIEQKDRQFSQIEITIKPGASIVFTNSDEITHNVFSNSKDNAFNIKVQTPGNSSTVTFTNEGVTEVRCAIHPKMKLLVTVKK